jgi:hypothetical protein
MPVRRQFDPGNAAGILLRLPGTVGLLGWLGELAHSLECDQEQKHTSGSGLAARISAAVRTPTSSACTMAKRTACDFALPRSPFGTVLSRRDARKGARSGQAFSWELRTLFATIPRHAHLHK